MKNKILKLVADNNNIALTSFKNHIPEIVGECDFHFPAKGIDETNVLLIAGVNKLFIDILNELITIEVLSLEPCSAWVVANDGGEVYNLPIVKSQKLDYKTLHWLPLLIRKGQKFQDATNI